ncbi:hypothetical protein QNZ44_002382 [Enterobacter kobei]|uniref:hypothetical protein n=1 Tax=Enterobacter cloacae complex TaxID=354276 RepID=UPI001463FD6A|nr:MULTISPECIES: hypothetical protein [Enterobacter cloacae complex]MBC5409470.1 hypothetical protein [Klebsiella pneumoniae]HDT4132467.1 hypothetical protein [Klebsiella pneumoniae subsp. pneumoniae]MBL5927761.1 hypothetical protein [Enterobacter asburiae]MBL5958548.1 hypothetical protein [Enterobacter asburiae]MCE1262300.1 hypothetical protein [Enterobacter kobei]
MSILTVAAKYKDLFSVLSFIIACTSLFFSGRTAWHDRSRLKISGRVVYEPVYEKAYKIEVTVLNVGRRDAVLEGILCHYEGNNTRHSYEKNGFILKEKQREMFQIEFRDLVITDDDGNAYELENITVLDVEGKEHEIPNSKNLIARFSKDA